MEYGVIGPNHAVPILNQRLVHLVYVLEWAVAISDDIGVVEMCIGREERVLGVEFVVHVFFTNLDSWRGEAKSLQTLQRFGRGNRDVLHLCWQNLNTIDYGTIHKHRDCILLFV